MASASTSDYPYDSDDFMTTACLITWLLRYREAA